MNGAEEVKSVEQLSRENEALRHLIDTSPVGVAVFDATTGHPVSHNREARRIVSSLIDPGQTVEELLQVVTCRFSDRRETASDEFPLPAILHGAATVRGEQIELSVRGGRSVRALVNAAPVTSDGGEVQSVVVAMQDLGPLDELERQRAEILELVSHELRAPLSAIKGLAATVLGNPRVVDPAEVRQFFRIIEQQADDMDGLIRDLLDAGRIDNGTLSVDSEPQEVSALVDHARSTFLSSGARHHLHIDLPPGLPRVIADKRRIVQVLNNLFANAARHSLVSCPIQVAAARAGAELAISVFGEGSGVPPEQLPQLFRKHSAGGGQGADGGRDGLGLAICKGLVEAHGGRIRAESLGPGQGTRITFRLPAVEEPGRGGAEGPAAPLRAGGRAGGVGGGPGQGTRITFTLPAVEEPGRDGAEGPSQLLRDGRRTGILVVDDDPLTLRIVRDALTRAGYAPAVTGDPREVPRLIRRMKPELVLLDLMFPGLDGIALMESVPALADLPVIFISGYGRDETIVRALEAGAADYIVKPFSPTELTARVRAALRKRTRPDPFLVADLAIDYERRRVTVGGRAVRLTVTEYELLRILSVNAGRVLTYESLLRQIWGERVTESSEPVRTFVKKLRGKLGDFSSSPKYIFNERGIGYRMVAPGDR